jgi:hypothetical protein
MDRIRGTRLAEPTFWAGWLISALVIVFLLFDGAIKLVPMSVVTSTMEQLGYSSSVSLARGLGVLTICCAVLYAIPQTSLLGAILLTGLLGGAIATHLRVGSPIFSHLFFGIYLGLLAWGGLYLRDRRLRRILPLVRSSQEEAVGSASP